MACVCVKSNRKKLINFFVVKKQHDRYFVCFSGSSKSTCNCNNRATSAASPASAARYNFVRPELSPALMSAGIAVVVVAIESVCLRGASLFCCVCAEKKRQRNETKKKRNQAKTNVLFERKNYKTK